MELRQLKYFVSIAMSKTMTDAAERLHISQSALSLSIKKLEDELFVSLFSKQGRNIVLTEAGKLFLDKSINILEKTDELKSQIASFSNRKSSNVIVGLEAIDIGLEAILVFGELNPDIELIQRRTDKCDLKSKLISGEVDIGISLFDYTSEMITSTKILSEPMKLLVNKRHKYSQQGSVFLGELENESFILTEPQNSLSVLFQSFFQKAGISPPLIVVGDPETMALSVQNNFGVTFIPQSVHNSDYLAEKFPLKMCNALSINEDYCCRTVYISYLKSIDSIEFQSIISFFQSFGRETQKLTHFPTALEFVREVPSL